MVFSVSDFLSLSLSSWYGILWPKPLGGWEAGVGCMGCVWVQGLGRQSRLRMLRVWHTLSSVFPVLLEGKHTACTTARTPTIRQGPARAAGQ